MDKETLERVRADALDCVALCEQAARYRELAMQCTQALTGMPGNGSKTGKQERFVLALIDVQKELQERLNGLILLRKEAETSIEKLCDVRHRAVLSLYYLSGLPMDDAAEKMSVDRSTAFRLKKEALEMLE